MTNNHCQAKLEVECIIDCNNFIHRGVSTEILQKILHNVFSKQQIQNEYDYDNLS